MTRTRPRNRLMCETVKVAVGGARAYLQIDRDPQTARVEHVVITPSGKHGSDFQQLCVELSRLINHALQEKTA